MSGITSTDTRNNMRKGKWSPPRSGQTEQQDVLMKIHAARSGSSAHLLWPAGEKRISSGNCI